MNSLNKQLGEFLRFKRESLSPKVLGLQSTKRRRTPGLRREEVAELAGISADWYMRLEQGRDSLPSKMTAEALAKVLRLNAEDRSHLLTLSLGHSGRIFKKEIVPTHAVKLCQQLLNPAYIVGARYDLLCWNQPFADIFGDFSEFPEGQRNVLYQMFTSAGVRKHFVNWEKDARDLLESFRSSYDLWAHSVDFNELVKTLCSLSPEFKKWWKAHTIQVKSYGENLIQHKKFGKLKLSYSTFQLVDSPDLKLVIYGSGPSSTRIKGQ